MLEPISPVPTTDVAVIGGGPAGLTAAIALASAGIETTLIGKPAGNPDRRTTALLAGSVTALDTLGVWRRCAPQAAPLVYLRLVDDTGRLWRAPEVKFDAREIGLPAFGYNIANTDLIAALETRAAELTRLHRITDQVTNLDLRANAARITLNAHGTLTANIVIGADGRRSLCRDAAGIAMEERNYPQSALALSFAHTRPHHDTSTEFHTASGPFTVVPLPGNRSSLVWMLSAAEAETLAAFDDTEINEEIERRSHSILGKISVEPGRGLFPLAIANALPFAQNRVALVGEAAHLIPPIGAQGLNLGLRDAAVIGELLVEARDSGETIASTLARYDEMRRRDVGSRSLAVDLFNRSLLSDFLPLQGARGLGLYLIDRIGPLRRAVMREGIAPAAGQPRLMRGEAL